MRATRRSSPNEGAKGSSRSTTTRKKRLPKKKKIGLKRKLLVLFLGLCFCGAVGGGIAVWITWNSLPPLNALVSYRPRVPLRIYTADNVLIGEYGRELREVTSFDRFPPYLVKALLAAEDSHFYEHDGVSWTGIARAILANIEHGGKAQGASTLTMQVARNFYLSKRKTYRRKFIEFLLAFKIEHEFSKNDILTLYMNQVYLGNHAYGFAAASKMYFGVPVDQLTLAQAAVLAGLPQAPSRINPFADYNAAKARQKYVLGRMLANDWITQDEYNAALKAPLHLRDPNDREAQAVIEPWAAYIDETVRQSLYNQYGQSVYSRGLTVYTTIISTQQEDAYYAVRDGVANYTANQPYDGPVTKIDLPQGIENQKAVMTPILETTLASFPSDDNLYSYLVLNATPTEVTLIRKVGSPITLRGASLKAVKDNLPVPGQKPSATTITRGAVVYVYKFHGSGLPMIINKPTVEGAFVAMDPQNGAIRAMMGGFGSDNSFNRVTQAYRQPGSIFKPFVYAAALERGVTPQTLVSDQPFYLPPSSPGEKGWEPKNYGNVYSPTDLTMRQGLYHSKNMVSIRILQAVGPDFLRSFLTRLGFDLARQPNRRAYLTTALGAGAVSPLQMATTYSIFANGGYRVRPYLIDHVIDSTNNMLLMSEHPLVAGSSDAERVLDPRTAYVMNDLLRGVMREGTGRRAGAQMGHRPDLAGKTGTTNKSFNVWFVGYVPSLVGVVWMGYDKPKSLGQGATGGGTASPIWVSFMKKALTNVPVVPEGRVPMGLIRDGDAFWFSEFPPGKSISVIGTTPETTPPADDSNVTHDDDGVGSIIPEKPDTPLPPPTGLPDDSN